jgi:hypothetical protein
MPRMSGVWEQEKGDEYTNCMLSSLKGLMHHKYGDIFLLCAVALAFGMLLALSATG